MMKKIDLKLKYLLINGNTMVTLIVTNKLNLDFAKLISIDFIE